MNKFIDLTVRFIRAGRRAYARKLSFLGVFAVIFLGSVTILGKLELLPETPLTPVVPATAQSVAVLPVVVELPTKIEIPAISLTATIANPTATNIEILDKELLKGAVRYPTSAKLGETGNVVLFGHSSYLPVVGNQAYKAFNGIQKLVAGDVITVYSADAIYTYRVRSMEKENAASGAGIQLSVAGRVLTLSTCNSFGTKEDRFVVTADFVESHLIST